MLRNEMHITNEDDYPKDWSEIFIMLESMLKQYHDAKLDGDEKRAGFVLVEADAVMLELRRANAR